MSNCILYSFLIGPKCFWVKINITSLLCLFLTKTSSGLHCAFKHYKQGLGWTYVTEVSICILFSSLLGLKRFSLFNMIMHSVVDRYSSRTTDRRREQQNRVPLFRWLSRTSRATWRAIDPWRRMSNTDCNAHWRGAGTRKQREPRWPTPQTLLIAGWSSTRIPAPFDTGSMDDGLVIACRSPAPPHESPVRKKYNPNWFPPASSLFGGLGTTQHLFLLPETPQQKIQPPQDC